MLRAGVFDDFKGGTTLLLWGDGEGMARLFSGLSALANGKSGELIVDGPGAPLRVCMNHLGSSTLRQSGDGFHWECSAGTLKLARDLTGPLLTTPAGHQFLDVDGLAAQVIIARDEYPADLR
jgi:hypothetical protein